MTDLEAADRKIEELKALLEVEKTRTKQALYEAAITVSSWAEGATEPAFSIYMQTSTMLLNWSAQSDEEA